MKYLISIFLFLTPIFSFEIGEINTLKQLGFSNKEILLLSKSHSSNSHRFDLILKKNKIVVGTTGDYAPFSYRDPKSNVLMGIDIDLARHLSSSLGVELEFYQTSWPNLLKDLQENRFDIAMSGISKTLSRQKVALFSKAYIQNGKTAISRCSDQEKYNSLEKIDQKKVNVIVNPGGTNHSYALQNIKHAKVRVFDNNNLIFQEILEHRADVMITDSVEVAYHVKKHANLLCSPMKKTLSSGEIAILISRDFILKEYIQSWLELLERSGEKTRIFQKYINY
ncbi:transporter substrate-binding domain-containing protein [bacterium]|nr:transporter substrate-binding domain-containing protein [bacterium]